MDNKDRAAGAHPSGKTGARQFLRADGLAALALASAVRSFAARCATEGRTVLDMGCGTMPYKSFFTARGALYLGADIDGTPDLLIGPNGQLSLPDASVDVVVSFQVLEHVRDVPAYLSTIYRLLKPEGHLFVSTHGVWPYHPHPTDFWRWTRDGLQEILKEAGFEVRRTAALCGPAAWLTMFPLLAGKSALGRAWPLLVPVNVVANALAWVADRATPAGIRDNNAAIFAVELTK